jgi:hypothetical protein
MDTYHITEAQIMQNQTQMCAGQHLSFLRKRWIGLRADIRRKKKSSCVLPAIKDMALI